MLNVLVIIQKVINNKFNPFAKQNRLAWIICLTILNKATIAYINIANLYSEDSELLKTKHVQDPKF